MFLDGLIRFGALKKEGKGRFSWFFPQFVNFFKQNAELKQLLLLSDCSKLLIR